jgi:hypothetical protein
VKTIMNLWVPYSVGKFLSSWATGGFSTRAQLHGVSYWAPIIRAMLSINFLYFNPLQRPYIQEIFLM